MATTQNDSPRSGSADTNRAAAPPHKKALVTGITGQDGSYLTEFLLKKGYEVHGLIRRPSNFNIQRINHIYIDPHNTHKARMKLHYANLTDASSLRRWIDTISPDEVYNLAPCLMLPCPSSKLGNLTVEETRMMLQQEKPDDYKPSKPSGGDGFDLNPFRNIIDFVGDGRILESLCW